VGYEHNHGPRETLDVAHLKRLLASLLALDETKLAIERQPGEDDFGGYSAYMNNYGGGSNHSLDPWDDGRDYYTKVEQPPSYSDAVKKYPNIAARLLEELGVEYAEFRAHVFAFSGHLLDEDT
jgi:hypothetical protein